MPVVTFSNGTLPISEWRQSCESSSVYVLLYVFIRQIEPVWPTEFAVCQTHAVPGGVSKMCPQNAGHALDTFHLYRMNALYLLILYVESVWTYYNYIWWFITQIGDSYLQSPLLPPPTFAYHGVKWASILIFAFCRIKEKAPHKIELRQRIVLTRFRTALGGFSVLTDPAPLARLEMVNLGIRLSFPSGYPCETDSL